MKIEKLLEGKILLLKEKKKLVLIAYVCCLRMIPNYIYFSNKQKFGDLLILFEALGLAKLYLNEGVITDHQLQDYLDRLYLNIPDSEVYPSLEASYAQRAISAVYYMISYLLNGSIEEIKRILRLSFDTIYFFLSNELDMVDQFEQHPLFIKEINNIEEDYSEIQKCRIINRESLEKLEKKYFHYKSIFEQKP